MVSHRRKVHQSPSRQPKVPPVSSLAGRQILPQSAVCRQRYNAAFQALQHAYKQKQVVMTQSEQQKPVVNDLLGDEELVQLKRNLANHRERWRTEELNEAFKQLRRIVPALPSDKMSKIHTLRIATAYIRFLDQMDQTLDYAQSFMCEQAAEEPYDPTTQETTTVWPSSQRQAEIGVQGIRANFNAWRAEMAASSLAVAHQQQTKEIPSCEEQQIEMEQKLCRLSKQMPAMIG